MPAGAGTAADPIFSFFDAYQHLVSGSNMQIPNSILKKMALGAGSLALAAGAAYAATEAVPAHPVVTTASQLASEPAPTPTATPAPKPKSKPKVKTKPIVEPAPQPPNLDPCPPCGRG